MFATTEHLNIRGFVESDSERMLAMYTDPRVSRTATLGYIRPFAGDMGKKFVEAHHNALLHVIIERKADPDAPSAGDAGTDAAAAADTDSWVGHMAIFGGDGKNRDGGFGIAITPKWWGHGYATEVTRWTVEYSFEQLGLHRLSLGLLATNEAALRVYTKSGFVQEGRKRGGVWQDGKWVDLIDMGITAEDYFASKQS